MSPNQCQNMPLGSYLQTRVLGASSRDRMNQIRVTEDRGCVSPVEASHSLPTSLGMWDIPKNVKRPQSHPLQRVRTNTCLMRTKLLHLRGQNQTQGKRRGEIRSGSKNSTLFLPHPSHPPATPSTLFPSHSHINATIRKK